MFDFPESAPCMVLFSPIFATVSDFFTSKTICVKSGPMCGQNAPYSCIIDLKKSDSKIDTIIDPGSPVHHNYLLASDLRNIGLKKEQRKT